MFPGADRLGMHWFTRLLGLAVILGLVGWSFLYTLDQIAGFDAATSANRDQPASDDGRTEAVDRADTPQYLAFVGGIPSGRYQVADLPGSRDWDYGERRGRTPESPVISEENPVNFSLQVEDNDYVQAAETGDPTNADESDTDESDTEEFDTEEFDTDESASPFIKPGLYGTRFGVTDCEYELRRIMDDNRDRVIGHDHVQNGRLLVTINEIEPDTFIATESCGEWTPWTRLTEPLTSAGNGDYWIGDLARGVWDVPAGCYWEKVVGFRGATMWDIEDAGNGPEPLVIDRHTLGVRVRHCGQAPMTRSDASGLAEPPPWELPALDAEAHQTLTLTGDREIGSDYSRSRRRRR